jgi:cell division inhibitor SulA
MQGLHCQLNQLSQRQQWIMFTAQCSRENVIGVSANQSWSSKVIHIMPSRQLSEIEVVKKAIHSGNASAIVASNQIDRQQQTRLAALAETNGCQLFFVNTTETRLH